MSKKITWMLSLVLLGASGAVGWGLLKVITPSPDVLVKELPESNPAYMTESRRRNQEWMNAIKAAADNPNPIYKSFDPKKV